MRYSVKFIPLIIILLSCCLILVSPLAAGIANTPHHVVDGISGPGTGLADKQVMISSPLKNTGTASAGSSYSPLNLSSEAVITSDHRFWGKGDAAPQGSGVQKTIGPSGTIPVTIRPYPSSIGIPADGSSRVAETTEGNYGTSSAGQIAIAGSATPDLVVTAVSAPASASVGKSISISSCIRNSGDASSSYFYVYFYLSEDRTIGTGDMYLGKVFVPSLLAGSEKTLAYSAIIPTTAAPGTWYIGAVADGTRRIAEKNEENNTGSGTPVTVQRSSRPPSIVLPTPQPTTPVFSGKPDLVITSVSAPVSGSAGRSATLSSIVKNTGDAPASYSYVIFYLSRDTTLDAGDPYLGRGYVSSLMAGSTKTVSITPLIPFGTAEGTYYICSVADGTGLVIEKDEGNNIGVSGVLTITGPPRPDLMAVSVSSPQSGSPGGIIDLQLTVRNSGTIPVPETGAAVWLSPDPVIGTGDILLGPVSVPDISGGMTNTLSVSMIIPASVAPGTYYLGITLDSAGEVAESDESNNVACSSGTLVISPVSGGSLEEQVEIAIIRYTNQERLSAGLSPLAISPKLTAVARSHSLDMKIRDFFSHNNPDWLDPFDRMTAGGYTFWCAAENIACTSSFTKSSTADEVGRYFVQEMWMQSTGHRENILDSCITEIGVGVVYEGDRSSSPYGFIATQNFGKPR